MDVLGYMRPPTAPNFRDDNRLADWARDDIGKVQHAGIMGGVGNNDFEPHGLYTREQAIVTLMRLHITMSAIPPEGGVYFASNGTFISIYLPKDKALNYYNNLASLNLMEELEKVLIEIVGELLDYGALELIKIMLANMGYKLGPAGELLVELLGIRGKASLSARLLMPLLTPIVRYQYRTVLDTVNEGEFFIFNIYSGVSFMPVPFMVGKSNQLETWQLNHGYFIPISRFTEFDEQKTEKFEGAERIIFLSEISKN
jgi:hypothetical protein